MSSSRGPSFLSGAVPRQASYRLSVDLKHWLPCHERSQIPDGSCAPLLYQARSSLPVRCALRAPSGPSREALPRARRAFLPWREFVLRPAFSFLVTLPVVAPARLQPAPVNNLLVNWETF